MNFGDCVHPHNQHVCHLTPSQRPLGTATPTRISFCMLALSLPELRVNGIEQYVLFCVCLLRFTVMFLRLFKATTNIFYEYFCGRFYSSRINT